MRPDKPATAAGSPSRLRKFRQINQQIALSPIVESRRLITRNVVLEDGLLEAESDILRYTAIWVRRDGKWLLDGVREAVYEPQTHYDHLRPLAWMIGDWQTEEGSSVRVEGSCQWNRERTYLLREIRASRDAGQTITVSQRIGWDARAGKIRVWSFDTAGGHSEGVLSREGKHWVVTSEAVTPEGKAAESRNTYTRLNDDAFSVESSSQVEGKDLPDQQVRLVRKLK